MKFLVILICLAINYLWLKDFDRFDDTWFFRFRRRVEQSLGSADRGFRLAGMVPLVFIYGIPLLTVGLLLLFLQGTAFGLPVMLVHILVLLVAFDRTQPGNMVRCFLQRWREGDSEGCKDYLRAEMSPAQGDLHDDRSLSEFFKQQLVYRCFEKMFVVFFWYMLTGPVGVTFVYVSYQLRDTQEEDQAETGDGLVATVIRILEWVPVRLLAITFSLAGNFVACFDHLKQSFWFFANGGAAAVNLYQCASYALRSTNGDDAEEESAECHVGGEDDATVGGEDDAIESAGSTEESEMAGPAHSAETQEADSFGSRWRKAQETEMEDLLALLERSQAIWLAVLALITIYGLRGI